MAQQNSESNRKRQICNNWLTQLKLDQTKFGWYSTMLWFEKKWEASLEKLAVGGRISGRKKVENRL
ncbi:hypothetical protein FG379_002757 [Cryptosporidium bovis]|uniref:uncharacterized protein n=1 Tax=Cryptosporidium bovis TaxID=310047 RepID=UPI00351A7E38|nr:hypothetical protein FG379_002757 [Cryptosporidium bovis]